MPMPLDAPQEPDDEALLALFAGGDRAAARTLTLRLTPMVLGLATRMLTDRAEAEDVAQEAMMRLWKIAPDWRTGEAKVSTWLYQVARNLCTDRLRKKRGQALDSIPEPEDDRAGVVEQMEAEERAQALYAALADLPDRQSEAVRLRHIEGLGNPVIARQMDISVEAVESLIARGKRALAARLRGARAELGLSDG
ncbi:RNA polymerase sigma factor [Vannielia litorea]|uniref:RNA polymerase sigma factor n=1 Tax=Vannielia litorea TaxID=1217970 RepID=UPI001C945507|nr:RNA polymerase sigma factor [Vannielia litorea]MBY6046571.1 RNA polymerase sigma factor [Vannielia litorea]MBY6073985.1 RNA polymerase sigma factor [Vannielia litorea]MBY6153521.1 RNA polymerase sigma factor [Vannielia litorea]